MDFMDRTHTDIKTNNWQMRLRETRKLLYSKGHYQSCEETACQVEKKTLPVIHLTEGWCQEYVKDSETKYQEHK